jgi:ubiquinone/menaquinone biosynthesis C-methylase UbiE
VKGKNPEEKKIHYKLTKDYFRESAIKNLGYYDAKCKSDLKHDSKQYKIWEICNSFIDKLIKNNEKISNVIDIGCGIGDFTIDLAKKYPTFKKIIGVDFLNETIDIARRDAEDCSQVSFEIKDLLKIDYDDRFFDVSICINVFHHIHCKDSEKAIMELSRISDKYVILEIRNKKNIFNFWYKYIIIPFLYKNLPVNSFSVSEVNNMFNKNNFELVYSKGIYPRIWICRRLILIYKRTDITNK